ncbi:sensor histidine kinase, partial [Micromonospora sp. NPDC003776]
VALYLVSAALLAFYALGYPGFPPALVLAVPLYDAALAGHVWRALPVPVFFLAAGSDVSIRRGLPPLDTLVVFLPQVAVVAVALLLGALVRSRRAYAEEVRLRLAAADRERDQEARRRVGEERLRIAREVHDTVGHALATITVQSAAALRQLDREPDQVRAALPAPRAPAPAPVPGGGPPRPGRRPPAAARAPARDAGLDRLPELLAAVRAAGLTVELRDHRDARPLPGPVDHAAYRVVQESLTNALKHAGVGASVTLSLDWSPAAVVVRAVDDGRGRPVVRPAPSGGHGLVGMRERVGVYEGRLTAGPTLAGGWRVEARLPLPSAAGPEEEKRA